MPNLVILSISEAYSMQPILIRVCDKEKVYSNFAFDAKVHEHDESCVLEIKYEIDANIAGGVLVGYNKDGKELFRYLEDSVNIHFKS